MSISEKDLRIKYEILLKDKEELKRRSDQREKEMLGAAKKEEDLQSKLDENTKQMRDRELLSEKRAEENLHLK